MTTVEQLKHTPLYAMHLERGAKMVPFGGWEMPVSYTSIVEEHTTVRQRAGLFDVSHMGQVLVAGSNAGCVLNHLLTNDVQSLAVGQAQYALMCNERGGVIDDVIVYRVQPTVYLLVVNASNLEKDFAWMTGQACAPVVLENESEKTAMLALQGPAAPEFLKNAAEIPHFHITRQSVYGVECRVARTGYTGEDGFEILCAVDDAVRLWTELLARGAEFGVKACGLGARDTLRLEMGYPLNGNDTNEEQTPLEAGLGRFVSFAKGDFIGRDVLAAQKENGVKLKLIAFKMTEKSPPPRPHYPMIAGDRPIGEVTSGTHSPTLGTGIGMGYVASEAAVLGAPIGIKIRGRTFAAVIGKKPLLKWNQ